MKRLILSLMLVSSLALGARPAAAQDYYYQGGGYPVQQQNGNPVLQKVLIGGALLGAGFLAGRLTAPKPNYYPPVVNQYPPNYGGHGHHGNHHGNHYNGPQPAYYRGR